MLRRKSSGDGVALSAAYAPVRPRRKQHKPHVVATGSAPLSQANAMFLATVASPPQQRPQATSSRSILQKNRAVKFTASQPTGMKQNNHMRGQLVNDESEEELLGEREETPRRPSLKDKLLQESGTCIREKLAYDELLRYQRSRAEDMAKIFTQADEGDKAKQTQAGDFRRAAGFREEWRIGRENEILSRLEADAELMPNNAADAANRVLREHFRRSIHMFLFTDLAKLPQSNEVNRSGSVVMKRSQELLYAQQMDRVLSRIETQLPFAVMSEAIQNARTRFKSLLAAEHSICWTNDPSQCTPVPAVSHQPNPSTDSPHVAIRELDRRPELLQLYENVIDAKQVAIKATTMEARIPSKSRDSPAVVPVGTSDPKFLADLQQQRAEAKHQQNEIQARAHFRFVSVKRVQRHYRRYREREWQRKKAEALRRIAGNRATRVLQLRLVVLFRQYRSLRLRRLVLLHKHQGLRVALFCFWKHVYWRRCGFGAFRFDQVVDETVVKAVIRIQSFVRQLRAHRQAQHMRAFAALRARRRAAKDWRALRAFGQHVAPIDIELVEWKCRIGIEKQRVQSELEREETRFASEWRKYETKLQKEVLKSKLPTEWIPQMDPLSGEAYFLNTKTVKSSKEHPNRTLFNQLATKQRSRAEELYAGQLTRLEEYQQRLDVQFRTQVNGSLDEILAAMVAGTLGL